MEGIGVRALTLAALCAAMLTGQARAQSSPSPFTSAVRYDDGDRVTGTIAPDPDGANPLHYVAVRNSYDTAGRLVTVEKGELSGWQSEDVLPSAWTGFTIFQVTTTTYNQFSQKVTEAVTSGGTTYALTQYSYDTYHKLECIAVRMNPAVYGSLPSSACTLGTQGSYGPDRITRNVYDIAHRLIKVQRAYGTSLQQDYETYTLEPDGKPITVTDANGNKASMTYDGHDRQVQWNFPSQTSAGTVSTTDYETYGYDANDNRTSFRKRDGRTFTYSYDNLNRMTAKVVPDTCVTPPPTYVCTNPPTDARRDLSYTYDLSGHQLTALFQTGDGLVNSYDAFGRLATATNTMSGSSRTLSYLYDADGNRIRVTHPDGQWFAYGYDGLDRMSCAVENGVIATNAIDCTITNGAAKVVNLAYDAAGRASSLKRGEVTTAYTYDPVSRPASMADNLADTTYDQTATFAYNPANQLVTIGRTNTAYAFTGYATGTQAYTINGLNQYTALNSGSLGYDSNGNLASDGTTSYTYDAENRLVQAAGAKNATLIYDPNGHLFSIYDGTSTVQFLYDGDELIAEYNGSTSAVLRRYVHGSAEDDPMIWYEGSGVSSTNRRSLQADHEGSIVSVADSSGALTILNRYDEYGVPASTNDGRFQYTGQAWLPALGLYYYKARMYSSRLGRFLQTDPIGYKDQVNLYAYVGNDPVNGRDPTGKFEQCTGTPADCANVAGSAAAVRDAALKTPEGSTLREEAGELGLPGKGIIIVPDKTISSPAVTDQSNGSIHIQPSVVVIPSIGGQVIAHELGHASDFKKSGALETLEQRWNTERKAYTIQNEYSHVMGMKEVDVEKYAKMSVDRACSNAPATDKTCH